MENFWENCLIRFREEFDDTSFNAFIKPVSLKVEGNTFSLISPNNATERWLKQNVEKTLLGLIKTNYQGIPILSYQIVEDNHLERINPKHEAIIDNTHQILLPSPKRNDKDSGLRRAANFDSFVLGRANEIPFAAAKTIAEGEGNINPLFIYGNTGLGKTHLVQAIGNRYTEKYPDRRVLYVTARVFMKEVVHAFRLNQHTRFQTRYQDLDMLIIDDIQYIGGDKLRTQEEFFFLFNALYEEGKEIVITCDRSPSYIKDLPSRLVSRFNAGVTTHITPPEFELRADILHHKASQWGVILEEEVIRFIAEHVKSNVRELEGALKRVSAMARFQNMPISLCLCRKALADLMGKANVIIHPDIIKEAVARFYNVRVSDLSSKKRNRSIARPRHIAVYLCRHITNLSLPDIGQHFGKRNHSTVLHSCRQIEESIKNNKTLSDEIRHLEVSVKEECH